MLDDKPLILLYKILCKGNKPEYAKLHDGQFFHFGNDDFDCSPTLDGLQERDIGVEDLHKLILHGLLRVNDYEMLKGKGLIDSSNEKLWNIMEELKKRLAYIESNDRTDDDFSLEDLDIDSLPDDVKVQG